MFNPLYFIMISPVFEIVFWKKKNDFEITLNVILIFKYHCRFFSFLCFCMSLIILYLFYFHSSIDKTFIFNLFFEVIASSLNCFMFRKTNNVLLTTCSAVCSTSCLLWFHPAFTKYSLFLQITKPLFSQLRGRNPC